MKVMSRLLRKPQSRREAPAEPENSGQRSIDRGGPNNTTAGYKRMRDGAMAEAVGSIRDLGIAESEQGMRDLARSSGGPFKVGVMADAIEYMRELGIDDGAERLADAARGQGPQRRRGGTATPPQPPAAGRRQRDGQQRASERTPAGVYKLFRAGLSYRDIAGRVGLPESAVRVLYDEHRESKRTLAEKIRGVGEAPRLFPWSEVRAALTTTANNGGGLVGTKATGQLGFLHDMASMIVLEYLGIDDVRVGEDKSYWGEVLPQTGWTVEGGALVNNASPTLGTLRVKPLTVFGRYDVTSTLAHSSEDGFMNWLRDAVADLLNNQLVAALFDGDPADNKIEGFLRKTGFPTIYFGAALTEASIRSCVSLLRTNLGVGTMPVWLLSEGYRNAAVLGGWATETGVHTGVMLPDDAGGGIHYVVSQHLQHPAGADPSTDPEIVDPAILCYGDAWRIPVWGLMASQHMQPDVNSDQYALELLTNSVPLQPKSFVRTQGGVAP